MEIFDTYIDLRSVFLTLEVAGLTTLFLLIIGTPLAWTIAKMRSRWRVVLEAMVALPLVLPPTVLGFYLLIVMNPTGPLTDFLRVFGFEGQLTFSKTGLIIGSMIYSFPFAVQPLIYAFETVPSRLMDAAATLRASFLDRFFTIAVPLAQKGFLICATISFAHTVGEFGVVLMVGGNIPGETRMVAIDIFNYVENLEFAQAHILSAFMLSFSLMVLMFVYALNRKFTMKV